MPETNECAAHQQTAEEARVKLGGKCVVLGMHGDAASTDPGKHPLHVFRFHSKTKFKRGTNGSQTHVMPQELLKSKKNPNPPDVAELKLIAFLTHTSVQLYPRRVWEESVAKVDCKNRGFRVGLALEFEEYFLAFLTIDLVFQPEWFTIPESSVNLPIEVKLNLGVDVLRDYEGFLAAVADWTTQRRRGTSKRAGLACEAMRDASLVWVGVGVYTVCELFFLAGCAPFLLEYEVFDCPSRTARLCEAFWCWSLAARTIFADLVRPTIDQQDYIIAPTDDQRMRYSWWLNVWGKKQATMSDRMKILLSAYNDDLRRFAATEGITYRDEVKDSLYDVFEPQLIHEALYPPPDSNKRVVLGHLIFGCKFWHPRALGKERLDDALTKAFINAGLWSETSDAETHLRLEDYEGSLEEPNTRKRRAPVSAYKGKKQMWSVLLPFPDNLLGTRPPFDPNPEAQKETWNPCIYIFDKEETSQLTFEYIIQNTNKVAIGPLEYCGHGKVIKTPHGYRAFAVHGDPRLPEYHCFQSLWRVYAGKGLNKSALTNADLKKLEVRLASSKPRKSGDDHDDSSCTPPANPALPSTLPRKRTALAPSTSQKVLPSPSPSTFIALSSFPTVVAGASSSPAVPRELKRKLEDAEKENRGLPMTPKKSIRLGRGQGIRRNWEQQFASENAEKQFAPSRPKREMSVAKYGR